MTTLIIIAIVVAVAALAGAAALFMALQKSKQQAARLLSDEKESWQREQQAKLTSLRQQMLGSINRELQDPVTSIIVPLQTTRIETLPADAREKFIKALTNAQSLMKRLNMLLDFHYTGTASDIDFTFKLPKASEPKVVFEPMREELDDTPQPAKEERVEKPQPVAPQPVASQPVTPQPVVPQPTPQPVQQRLPLQGAGLVVDDSNAGMAANVAWENTSPNAAADKHQFTILMVDDAPEMCRFARDYFRGVYNVITANNGEQALEKLHQEDGIDLVVSDVTMPVMDGLELCSRIKSDLHFSHIPVILLTGRTEDEMEAEGLKLGADDYMTKPFNAETLRLRVKKLIEQKENRLRQFREDENIAASALATTDVDADFMQQVVKIIEDNMSDSNFTVETLGDQMDMSRTYLYKKILSITGKGPGEFIRTLRMKRGKQLLERGQMQVAEVAAAVGYNTPKRFTENFKQEYEMTPTEYVKKIRGDKR